MRFSALLLTDKLFRHTLTSRGMWIMARAKQKQSTLLSMCVLASSWLWAAAREEMEGTERVLEGKCPLISDFAAVIMSSMGCLFTKIQP